MTASSSKSSASVVSYPKTEEKERSIKIADYRPSGPKLEYLWCEDDEEPLQGQSLYLGGEILDRDFYCIPGHAERVLVCNIDTNKVKTIGPKLPGKYKWLRGIVIDDGRKKVVYGLPCHADTVLRIDAVTNQVTKIPIPYESFYSDPGLAQQQRKQEWKYHGGTICPLDGKIYAIPQSALHVLCIDSISETVTFIGPALEGRWKWYGGVVGADDSAIYGIPHDSAQVLRIHPDTGVTLHGELGNGGHKWHGASACSNGDIVCVPANADSVLVIRPRHPEPELFEIGDATTISTGRHRKDNKYKYLGAMMGPDDCVYCFPSGSERVLQVDPLNKVVRTVGPNIYDDQMERLCQNKWQNGVTMTHEQCVYAIPLAAESVLRIDCSTSPPKVTTWQLPLPHKGLAKWEGGTLAPNGHIYCVPNNHKAILRIEAAQSRSHGFGDEKLEVSPKETRREVAKKDNLPYLSGIPTLRSCAHRVKYNIKNRKHDPSPRDREGNETHTPWLPTELLKEDVFQVECKNILNVLRESLQAMLEKCDPQIVGAFRNGSSRLEDFVIPPPSTWRKVNGGQCEEAQRYLSDIVLQDASFLEAFDSLVVEAILPHLKHRLVSVDAATDAEGSVTFYYQRPPTIRFQPGPSWSKVKTHNDAEYGHQNGELNFWIPLTDRTLTGVDLWSESELNAGDFHSIAARPGEVISFHGSSCRHYVNTNESEYTRVSLDFRVGIEGFFDPMWEMRGTTDDHARREVRL
jgi:hypothetical protein